MKITKTSIFQPLCFCLALSTTGYVKMGYAQSDASINLQSTIKGNQEQPSVIYIVPWKTIEAPPATYKPLSSTVSANFALIDRDEFRRELRSRHAIVRSNQNFDTGSKPVKSNVAIENQ